MTDGTVSLPLFPLPGVVLLPETLLPLHVFEPRYREMLADALLGSRRIGMQTIDPEAPAGSADQPRLLPLGCAGRIVEHEPLEDGRSNIVLRGEYRYRIEEELPAGRAYRVARVRPLPVSPLPEGPPPRPGRRELRRLLAREIERLALSVGRPAAARLPTSLGDEGLVNEAACRLGLSPDEKYELLAMDRLDERYGRVREHVRGLQRRLDFLAPYRREGVDPSRN
ncbi:ATP-dependent protease [Acidobacteria bacterium ACD]|nr:MAG: ATP-dependent protease [Acidobacteriota bacterium]MDL1950554.1 ATP-dependent protease [Acidobacteria bacterium ACD]